MRDKAVVLGAGGFIGGHLVKALSQEFKSVVGVDIKPIDNWHQFPLTGPAKYVDGYDVGGNNGEVLELSRIMEDADEVYNLAADMGGMGFIEKNKLACMLTIKTSVNALEAAANAAVKRFFYASSACVYPGYLQNGEDLDTLELAEHTAYPADAEDGYGWEKLFTERLCRHYSEDVQLTTRVARYHNVYGPNGTWTGGREKAPAAICRKVATAALTGKMGIDIWGDGTQERSFMYIDDCIEGSLRLMRSSVPGPLNIGSSECVTINQLVDVAERIAFGRRGVLHREYILDAPLGVKGRSSDNTLIKEELGWEPTISLYDGMSQTYEWILEEIKNVKS